MGRGRSQTTTDLLGQTRDILERIQSCSVRAAACQLFTRGLIPSMEKRDTNKVSTLLDAAPLSANPGAD